MSEENKSFMEQMRQAIADLGKELNEKFDILREAIHSVEKTAATSTRLDNIRMEVMNEKEERHKLEAATSEKIQTLRRDHEVEIARVRTFAVAICGGWSLLCIVVGAAWGAYTYFHPIHP